MNIFCLHNVLWGLARMGASALSLTSILNQNNNKNKEIKYSDEGNNYSSNNITSKSKNSDLAGALLSLTVDRLHTFLPNQFGDILWSIGTLVRVNLAINIDDG